MTQDLHTIQTSILLVLLFKPKAKFGELNTTKMSTDHFTFHVKRLVELGLIEKIKADYYQLTVKGKEFANRYDTEKAVVERQAKLGVLVCGVKRENGITKYLLQQRLKEPYYGFWGAVSGKIRWGETVYETAEREFYEETGYKGKLRFVGTEHKIDYSNQGNLLEDKFFFVFRIENCNGNIIQQFEGGKNVWLTEKEINNLDDLFGDFNKILKMLKQKEIVFIEEKYKVERY